MRKLLLLLPLLLLTSLSYSQVEFTNEKDEFTGSMIIKTAFYPGVKKFKDKFIDEDQKLIVKFFFLVTEGDSKEQGKYFLDAQVNRDLGCLSSRESTMLLLFEDGEKLELTYVGDADCGDSTSGSFVFISKEEYETENFEYEDLYLSQESYIEELISKPISKIRVYGTESYMDVEVAEKNKFLIADHIKTILKNIE
jgi:hypothetical protein